MSDFITNLPSVIFKRIYHFCDADSKVNLSECLRKSKMSKVLIDSGVHIFKERMTCFLCQTEVFGDDLAEQVETDFGETWNTKSLGFNLLFKKEILRNFAREQLTTHTERKNLSEDHVETGHMISYLLSKMSLCFNTTNFTELRDHIEEVHNNGRRLVPENGCSYLKPSRRSLAMFILEPSEFNWTCYQIIERHLIHYRNQSEAVVLKTLDVMEKYHSVGCAYKPINLIYEKNVEIMPDYRSARNLHLYFYMVENELESHSQYGSYSK